MDLYQLQVNTLRRYKKHYKVPTRPGMNKAQLADVSIFEWKCTRNGDAITNSILTFLPFSQTIAKHFKTLPIKEKEIITYFIYMAKSGANKLDQKNGLANDGS